MAAACLFPPLNRFQSVGGGQYFKRFTCVIYRISKISHYGSFDDTTTILVMMLLIKTLLIRTLNMDSITYNDIAYSFTYERLSL